MKTNKKSIILTKEQKGKLITLVEELSGMDNIILTKDGFIEGTDSEGRESRVHWFEACFTWIPIMMAGLRGDWNYYCGWILAKMTKEENMNPIDFLWDKYEELPSHVNKIIAYPE